MLFAAGIGTPSPGTRPIRGAEHSRSTHGPGTKDLDVRLFLDALVEVGTAVCHYNWLQTMHISTFPNVLDVS